MVETDVDITKAEQAIKSEEQKKEEQKRVQELEQKLKEYEQKEQEQLRKQREEEEKKYFQIELEKQREAFEKQLEEVKSMRMSSTEQEGEGGMTQEEFEKRYESDPEFRAFATKEGLKLTGNPKYS